MRLPGDHRPLPQMAVASAEAVWLPASARCLDGTKKGWEHDLWLRRMAHTIRRWGVVIRVDVCCGLGWVVWREIGFVECSWVAWHGCTACACRRREVMPPMAKSHASAVSAKPSMKRVQKRVARPACASARLCICDLIGEEFCGPVRVLIFFNTCDVLVYRPLILPCAVTRPCRHSWLPWLGCGRVCPPGRRRL